MFLELLKKLKELYPSEEITMWVKADKGKLIVNGEPALFFNPELMLKQNSLQTILDENKNENFEISLKIFCEYIEKFIQKREKVKDHASRLAVTPGQLKIAVANTKSVSECGKYLGLSYLTLKKYAKLYNVELKYNKSGIGTLKGRPTWFKKAELQDIFDGKYPGYNRTLLKQRIIKEGYLEERCSMCGFQEKRVLDMTVPLVLDSIDGNLTNFKLENLRLICYNCSYLINPAKRTKAIKMLDDYIYRLTDRTEK